jgi:dTDP-4-dehydrorhamnose reductase
MKIVVLGSTGLLGSTVGHYLLNVFGEDNVFLSYRNENYAYGKNKFFFSLPGTKYNFDKIPQCDYLINCIGVIKPFSEKNIGYTIEVNSVFPWELSAYCYAKGIKLIHITTDCVFSGKTGKYDENAFHDCIDVYGKSKSLGEPKNAMVLRTSIIGEELHEKVSLVEWLKSQKKGRVNGYTNHLWSGVTTKQFSKICEKIIIENLYEEGIFHTFSNIISKCELLCLLNKKFNLDIEICSVEAILSVDRSLSTIKDLNSKLQISSIQEQIKEM